MFTDIKVGFACNNRCVHCVVEPARRHTVEVGRQQDSTTEQLLGFIADAQSRGSKSVVLTGGEVLLRRDFPVLLRRCLELGLEVAVQTNGRRLEHWVQSGVLDGVRVGFVVSMHGPDADVHDAITRRRGSFGQTVRGLRALAARPEIGITGKIVVSRRNMGHLLATVELMSSLGVRCFNVAFPHAEAFPTEELLAIVPRYHEVRDELERCAQYFVRTGSFGEFETVPFCVTTPAVWTRSADGALLVQSRENPGFIQTAWEEALRDWEADRRRIKYKSARCTECVFDKVCEGPWREYVDAYGDDELVPIRDASVVELL